jgi:hypothetical protein
MGEKRKASGDAPGTSPLPARIRTASTEDEDVSHGGGVLFVFLVSAPPRFLGFWCDEFDFLAPLHFDFDVTGMVSWFLADPGSGGERRRVEVETLPQPLPMAGMDANLTDSSAPGTSQPPARMRAASTDGDDVSHGGGSFPRNFLQQ